MAEVSAETDLFSKGTEESAVIFYLAKRARGKASQVTNVRGIEGVVRRWRAEGWCTSVQDMFGDSTEPSVYETGFAHHIDIAGVFEAPTLAAAYAGVDELLASGWSELFETQWSVGLREFQPVASRAGRDGTAPWAFFALWEWNDAWQAATSEERSDYDIECDEAFLADIESGISIGGRHRLDAQSPWHHLGIWEAPSFDHITRGMAMHEKVADFKFTTSRHFVGRRRELTDYLGGIA
jgi:hypothetical protein